MHSPLQRIRGPLTVLAFLLVGWIFLPTLSKLFVREAFVEFQAPGLITAARLREVIRHFELTSQSSESLAEAGRDLARANAALELRIIGLEAAAAENRRLRAMLGATTPAEFRPVVARIASRESTTWWSRVIIRRGREDGIRPGCPVVIGDRVVGRVSVVHLNTSEVELITSPTFRCSAYLEGDERRQTIFIQGLASQPFAKARALVDYIPRDYTAPAGQPATVRTTDLGGLYPAGLRLGTLESDIEEAPEGAWKRGRLIPSADLLTLSEVSVLVPTQPQPYEGLR